MSSPPASLSSTARESKRCPRTEVSVPLRTVARAAYPGGRAVRPDPRRRQLVPVGPSFALCGRGRRAGAWAGVGEEAGPPRPSPPPPDEQGHVTFDRRGYGDAVHSALPAGKA